MSYINRLYNTLKKNLILTLLYINIYFKTLSYIQIATFIITNMVERTKNLAFLAIIVCS